MKVKRIEGSIQRTILIGMIVDDNALGQIAQIWDKRVNFKSKFANIVGGWCVKFYEKYDKAPMKSIEGLFQAWAKAGAKDKDTVQLIDQLLTSLSDQYKTYKKESNTKWVVDQASTHFNETRTRQHAETMLGFIDGGEVDKAIALAEKFERTQLGQSKIIDILRDKDVIRRSFEAKSEPLIIYPGPLGEFFGDSLERDALVALMGPEKSQKCVSAEMEVLMVDGSVHTIEEIVKNKIKTPILTYNERTHRLQSSVVSKFWSNGQKPCIKVRTRTGRWVETTENHQYLTPDGWKQMQDIRVGEYIAVPKTTGIFGTAKVPEEKILFLAYMLTEGGCTSTQMTFTNTDPKLIADFKRCCASLGVLHKKRGTTLALRNGSNALCKELGIYGQSSKTKVVPNLVFTAPKNQVARFLKVFFSCDGCISKIPSGLQVRLSLANEKLIYQINHLLVRFGIVSKISKGTSTCNGKKFTHWTISITSQEYVRKFLEEINFLSYKQTPVDQVGDSSRSFLDKFPVSAARKFYKELQIELENQYTPGSGPGKYWRAQSGIKKLMGKSVHRTIQYQMNKDCPIMRQSFKNAQGTKTYSKYMGDDILWDEIEEIVNVGLKDTYDLSIPTHHNFICNDVLVHNTWWLIDMAWRAMTQRRKVLFLEVGDLSEGQIMRRLMTRAARIPTKPGIIQYPKSITKVDDEISVELEEREFKKGLEWKDGFDACAKVIKRDIRSDESFFNLSVHPNSSITMKGVDSIVKRLVKKGWVPDVVCIAQGSLVLTEKGLKPIEQICGSDRLWDGYSWVSHGGLVYKGIKNVITYQGLTATPDHQVWSEGKWRSLISCKRLRLPIQQTGMEGTAIRLSEDHNFQSESPKRQIQKKGVCSCQMQKMQMQKMDVIRQSQQGHCERMSQMLTTEDLSRLAICQGTGSQREMQESTAPILETLWKAWDQVQVPQYSPCVYLDSRQFGHQQEKGNRPNRQRWALRAWEPSAFNAKAEYSPYSKESTNDSDEQVQNTVSFCNVCRQHTAKVFQDRNDTQGDSQTMEETSSAIAPVWDIVNSGPFHRFTVQGLLVHNCIDYADILDHGGASGKEDSRDRINNSWKKMRAMSQEYHCLVLTATQAKATAYNAKTMDMSHFSEDKRKFAHVTGMLGLNRTPEERAQQLTRLGWLVLRESGFEIGRNVSAAGCLSLGNPAIRSSW